MMKKILFTSIMAAVLLTTACNRNDELADAYGNFEVDEILISAQMPGELIHYTIVEGALLEKGSFVAMTDTVELYLMKLEIIANQNAISTQSDNIYAQINVLKGELKNLEREQKRVQNLIEVGAATSKQLDDIDGNIDVVKSRIQSIRTQNAQVLGQVEALTAKSKQIDEKIKRSIIINPVDGTVLSKLSDLHEYTAPGKPLYKIANLNELDLRVFISGDQLADIKIGDTYTVKIDGPDNTMIAYQGIISWISSQSEFTPKTIQTKEERVDLVYAVKLRVKNDGKIKIGMPGELWLNDKE